MGYTAQYMCTIGAMHMNANGDRHWTGAVHINNRAATAIIACHSQHVHAILQVPHISVLPELLMHVDDGLTGVLLPDTGYKLCTLVHVMCKGS